jgi:hypothetical protein
LADPTRRRILDELTERDGKTLFEICSRLATKHQLSSTRQAISRHIELLEAAGLAQTKPSCAVHWSRSSGWLPVHRRSGACSVVLSRLRPDLEPDRREPKRLCNPWRPELLVRTAELAQADAVLGAFRGCWPVGIVVRE